MQKQNRGKDAPAQTCDSCSAVRRRLTGHVLHATPAVAEAPGLAGAVAEVVELGATRVGPAENLELGDHRRVDVELPLHPNILDDAADGDHLVLAAALADDEHALEDLDPLLVPFHDADVDVDGVTDIHAGEIGRASCRERV